MTDRELLEAAAKAAGYKCWRSKHGYLNVTRPDGTEFYACTSWGNFDPHTGKEIPEPTLADAVLEDNWNPLIDDGDAFRLALLLDISYFTDFGLNNIVCQWWCDGEEPQQFTHHIGSSDSITATRRAIVRAAAEIGRAMK